MNTHTHRSFVLSCVLAMAMMLAGTGNASTIALIGTADLINNSELVFEGEAIESRTELSPNGRIYTFVAFRVNEVLIGSWDPVATQGILELRFTGGAAFGMELDLGVRIPQEGERGIYFVERVAPGLINPLLGWEQGHFTIGSASGSTNAGFDASSDAGSNNNSDVVFAANNREVRSVELQSRPATVQFSSGVANGITTAPAYDESQAFSIGAPPAPMSVDDFKSRILELAN